MSGEPNYAPVHRLPVWLSSEDVKAEIVKLAEAGMDKAACWDFNHAINMLCKRAHLATDGGKTDV